MDPKNSRVIEKITDLQLMEIVTKDGKRLGHLFDLRSPGEPEHGLHHKGRAISELVYGTLGLLERLGLKQATANVLSWESVIEIKDGNIIVEEANKAVK